jgi:hypothetical protein
MQTKGSKMIKYIYNFILDDGSTLTQETDGIFLNLNNEGTERKLITSLELEEKREVADEVNVIDADVVEDGELE